jgi:putative lipoprotein
MRRIKLTVLIAMVGVVTFTSCQEVKRPSPTQKRINVTPPSREAEAISQLTASIDEISANLDSISTREAMLCRITEHADKKSKIILQIKGLGNLLTEKQNQIDKLLSERVKKVDASAVSNPTIDNLYKMIEFLSSQLKEKGYRVNQLEQVANRKDVTVDQLKYIVMNQANSVDAMRYRFNMATLEKEYALLKAKENQRIKEEKELNKVYYIIANKETLKEKGLLKVSFFSKKVNNNNVVKELFTEANSKDLKTLNINSSSPKLLSQNPEGSYTLTENEDGTTTLTITNTDKFWNVSRYLIIQE